MTTAFRRPFARALAAPLLAALMLAGCAEGGLDLGDAPGALVSEQEVTQMSLQTWQRIKQDEQPVQDEAMQQRIDQIAQRITKAADVAGGEPWEVVVFKSDQVNAFALPGRRIGIYAGLVELADSDAEIAGVVAHEVGHVLKDHSRERLGAAKVSQVSVQALNAALQAGNVSYANQIAGLLGAGAQYGVVLPYGRTQELEADRFGLMTMAKAGYDPRAAIDFWTKMGEQSEGKAPPEFTSTHPSNERRLKQLREMLPEAMEVYRRKEGGT
ncbi:M48 family metallopeptidase [Rhodovibrio salinarum]|uniref:Peptidase M48 domain-containing protein n=1 Tax=Rhodovibrio salinarum TaxID=1087 RepID=A0A934QG13_9PROT|nr:M48 family metallopeptidase [Rhodovibrio salinarum]MBK1696316.1 hypothetical protein [Rhodovibrio salinarum]